MLINANKPQLWKADIIRSVDFYNNWFMRFAPKAFRETRFKTTLQVEKALEITKNLTQIDKNTLKENPNILPILRMVTCPPIARDRLIGLSSVSPNMVKVMEEGKLPKRMDKSQLNIELNKIGKTIEKMMDIDIFPWLETQKTPQKDELIRASTIVADRLCGSIADPIIRNAQEKRQLSTIKRWLKKRNYKEVKIGEKTAFEIMQPGTFTFRLNVSVNLDDGMRKVNIPIDAVVMPMKAKKNQFPILIEAKSAGDFTNTNKRRKEEAMKISQLHKTYGKNLRFNLFLCGYFDSGYLGYEAAEGIDWIWEHRIDDFTYWGICQWKRKPPLKNTGSPFKKQ